MIATTVPETLHRLVLPQIPLLQTAGWQILLVSASNSESLKKLGMSVTAIPMSRTIDPARDARAWSLWFRFLTRTKPEIVMGSTPKAGLLSMTAAKAARVPYRVFLHRGARWETLHGPRRHLIRSLERVTMRAATHNLAVSKSLADLVYAEGLTKTPPRVLGQGASRGVNLDVFRPAKSGTSHDPTLGFIGRLTTDKGVASALEALDHIRRSYPQARLLVAGRYDETDPVPQSTRDKLERDPAVTMLGQVSDIPQLLNSIDVLVFPSAREGFPNAVIEAAACGVPTVGWDVVTPVVVDGQAAVLCCAASARAWAGVRSPSEACGRSVL